MIWGAISKSRVIIFLMLLLLLVVLAIVFTGCFSPGDPAEPVPRFPLEVMGDVENALIIERLEQLETIEYREKTIKAVPLKALLDKARPHYHEYSILLEGDDGLSALIDSKDLTESYITYNREYGWEAINFNHPVSSNIKEIRRLVVITEELPPGKGFNIIDTEKNLAQLSVGSLYKLGYMVVPQFRGEASVSSNGIELATSTFYRRKVINLEDHVNLSSRDIIVVGDKGEMVNFRQDGNIFIKENDLGYMTSQEIIIDRVVGLVLDPPQKMITDVYHDGKRLLQDGHNTLLILIDGLGYHQYQYASENGYAPFLKSLPVPQRAMVAYPPVTTVNVAASLTGELPHINGAYRRGIRQVKVPTIFGFTNEHGKKATAIIGPIQSIEKEISPIMCVDRTGDGSTDLEKTETALSEMTKGYNLMFVHYKDVDIFGHDYGDLAEETMEAIAWNDSLVKELVAGWEGKVIIYADHGMHETEDGGNHAHLLKEDMFIPYWLFDTKEIN